MGQRGGGEMRVELKRAIYEENDKLGKEINGARGFSEAIGQPPASVKK